MSRSFRRSPYLILIVVLLASVVVYLRDDSSPAEDLVREAAAFPPEGPDHTSNSPGQVVGEVLSLTDATRAEEGWIVLDGRQGTVHMTDSVGQVLTSFARSGNGPGELTAPRAVAVHGDTVVVAEAIGGRVHMFDGEGAFLGSRVIAEARCAGPGMERVASTRSGLLLLVVCTGGDGRLEARVVLERVDGSSQVLVGRPEPGAPGSNPFFLPVFAAGAEGFLFGLALDECLALHALDGTHLDDVCHRALTRLPVPEDLRDHLVALQDRVERAGRTMAVPEVLPPFDAVSILPSGRVAYVVPVRGASDARALMILDESNVERPLIAGAAEHVFASRGGVLLGWDEMEGLRLTTRSLTESDP